LLVPVDVGEFELLDGAIQEFGAEALETVLVHLKEADEGWVFKRSVSKVGD